MKIIALCFCFFVGSVFAADVALPAVPAKIIEAKIPPEKGMVWHTLPKSKVYHVEGDHWYGRTKNGEWLTLADAEAKGYTRTTFVLAQKKEVGLEATQK